MGKYLLDLTVVGNERIHDDYVLLRLTHDGRPLPDIVPGQFVQVRVDGSPTTFLRRPISVNWVDRRNNQLWLLVRLVGDGTRRLAEYGVGEKMNLLLPLGNGFSIPDKSDGELLLVGGGVGTAPMLFLGDVLKQKGFKPIFLLGARTHEDLLEISEFEMFGSVYMTTEDGSLGEKGFVTDHFVLKEKRFGMIYACGPKPMMAAVAGYAKRTGIACEVSLENMMACGLGACLCCVEKTVRGNVCVCTEGPVFNINQLAWQI